MPLIIARRPPSTIVLGAPPPPSSPRHPFILVRAKPTTIVRAKPWRPEADDVERLSSGGAAKKRGTGSFHVPHRLSADERPPFAAAKKAGFLSVRGSGGRRGAKRGGGKGSGRPLLNTWRQWADAKGWACLVVEQRTGQIGQEIEQEDTAGAAVVIVDLSTARQLDARALAAKARAVVVASASAAARELGPFERGDSEVPFDVVGDVAGGGSEGEEIALGGDEAAALAEAAAVDAALARVPLRNGGDEDDAVASTTEPTTALPDGHPYATSAIWSIPPQPLFFEVQQGSEAKALAAELARALNGVGGSGGGGGAGGKKAAAAGGTTAARRRRVFDDYDD